MAASPNSMSARQVNAELDRLAAESWAIAAEMIAVGRGHELPSETLGKTDTLSLRYWACTAREAELKAEVLARFGTAVSRLPTRRGFGPRGWVEDSSGD